MISAIFAVDKGDGFGFKNKLPWYDPEDLDFFKRTTENHTVVMGRSTFESIGKELPNRHNVVISSRDDPGLPNRKSGAVVSILKDLERESNRAIFVIGGKDILLQSIPVLDSVILTVIKWTYPADCWIDTKAFLGETPYAAVKFKKVMEQHNYNSSRYFYIRK